MVKRIIIFILALICVSSEAQTNRTWLIGTNLNIDGSPNSTQVTVNAGSNPLALTYGFGIGGTIQGRPTNGVYVLGLLQGDYTINVGPVVFAISVPFTTNTSPTNPIPIANVINGGIRNYSYKNLINVYGAKVDANDNYPGYLISKLTSIGSVSLFETNIFGTNEMVVISVPPIVGTNIPLQTADISDSLQATMLVTTINSNVTFFPSTNGAIGLSVSNISDTFFYSFRAFNLNGVPTLYTTNGPANSSLYRQIVVNGNTEVQILNDTDTNWYALAVISQNGALTPTLTLASQPVVPTWNILNPARLGAGVPSASTVLYGNGWQNAVGGGTVLNVGATNDALNFVSWAGSPITVSGVLTPSYAKASSGQYGVIKVDGTTITAANGVITSVGGGGSSFTNSSGIALNGYSNASPVVFSNGIYVANGTLLITNIGDAVKLGDGHGNFTNNGGILTVGITNLGSLTNAGPVNNASTQTNFGNIVVNGAQFVGNGAGLTNLTVISNEFDNTTTSNYVTNIVTQMVQGPTNATVDNSFGITNSPNGGGVIFTNGNQTNTGSVSALHFIGDGSALTGITNGLGPFTSVDGLSNAVGVIVTNGNGSVAALALITNGQVLIVSNYFTAASVASVTNGLGPFSQVDGLSNAIVLIVTNSGLPTMALVTNGQNLIVSNSITAASVAAVTNGLGPFMSIDGLSNSVVAIVTNATGALPILNLVTNGQNLIVSNGVTASSITNGLNTQIQTDGTTISNWAQAGSQSLSNLPFAALLTNGDANSRTMATLSVSNLTSGQFNGNGFGLTNLNLSQAYTNRVQFFNLGGLSPWQSLKSMAATSIVHVLVIGDSISEGGTTYPGVIEDWTNTYEGQLRTLLQQKYGNGGKGLIDWQNNGSGAFPEMATGGAGWVASDDTNRVFFGVVGGGVQKGTGNSSFVSINGNANNSVSYKSIDVIYSVNPNSDTSGTSVILQTNGVTCDSFTVGHSTSGTTWAVHHTAIPLSNGLLRILCPSTGYFYFQGVILYDATNGIVLDQEADSGQGISNMLSCALSTITNGTTNLSLLAGVMKPALTIIAMTVNDYKFQLPIADYSNYLSTAVAVLTNYGSVLLLGCSPRDPTSFSWTLPQYQYHDQMREIASADANSVGMVDMLVRWGSFTNGLGLGLYAPAEVVHPSLSGHADYCRALADALGEFPSGMLNPVAIGSNFSAPGNVLVQGALQVGISTPTNSAVNPETNGYLMQVHNHQFWHTNKATIAASAFGWTNGFMTTNHGGVHGFVHVTGDCPTNQTDVNILASTNSFDYYGEFIVRGTNGAVSLTNLTSISSNGVAATIGWGSIGAAGIQLLVTPVNSQSNVFTMDVDFEINPWNPSWPIGN